MTTPIQRILVIDIGGTHIKLLATGHRKRIRLVSGPSLTAQAMVAAVLGATTEWRYDVVSIGYPGPVGADGPVTDPHNLAPGWIGFDFEKALKRPVPLQVLSDPAGGFRLYAGRKYVVFSR